MKLFNITILVVSFLFAGSIYGQNKSKQMTNKTNQTSSSQGNFAHIVYFWLNNPENENDREIFETTLSNFINNSEFIQTKHLGTPATTRRGVIDSSYTYCLLLTFENKEMQDKYQVEPNHLKFIDTCSKLWKKVIVYDSENLLK